MIVNLPDGKGRDAAIRKIKQQHPDDCNDAREVKFGAYSGVTVLCGLYDTHPTDHLGRVTVGDVEVTFRWPQEES
jgi:hypothetical protein